MKTFNVIVKGAKMVLAATTMTVAMTSCLGDGDSSYAYISGISSDCYANSNNAYVAFQSSSAWELKRGSDALWYTFEKASGADAMAGIAFINTELNTTDKYRTATINLTNTEGKSSSGQIYQWGTRGDGSLGSAKDVKKITGSDGSEITLHYDNLHRVVSLTTLTAANVKNDYIFSYPLASDEKRLMKVMLNGGQTASAQVNFGWQPTGDLASEDKSELVTWSALGSSQVTVKRNETGTDRNVQTINLTGFENPDSELSHNKLIYSYGENGKFLEMTLNIKHDSKKSNRKQSVDVNQLIFGVDNINPYMLVGFYRYARCSYIYDTAEDTTLNSNIKFTVSAALNSDQSVHTLTVGREDGSSVTYTFEY